MTPLDQLEEALREKAFAAVMGRADMPADDGPEYDRWLFEAAILAFLDAAMGDEGVVEKMARAMLADELKSKPRADFDAIWPEEDLIWLSNARAALAALKGDAP